MTFCLPCFSLFEAQTICLHMSHMCHMQGRRRLVKAELEKAYDSVKEMKALNEKLRQDYRLDSVDKIDRELEKLQAQQNSGQLSGSAEAKVVMEISKLQKNRADVSKARQQIDEKRDLGSCIPELKDQMNAISQSLTAIEKKEAGIKAELDALREQADVKNADIPELERYLVQDRTNPSLRRFDV